METFDHSTRLRVGFDISSTVGRRPRGIAGYVRALLPALVRVAPWIEPVLFLRDLRWFRRDRLTDFIPDAERRYLIEPVLEPLGDLDVFHGMGTRLPRTNRVPRCFTLHDLRGFDFPGEKDFSASPEDTRKGRTIRRADRIVTDSEHCRSRLLHHFPDIDVDTTEVIHLGVDHDRFRPRERGESEEVLRRLGISAPYLLQLGSFFPHKNLSLSIDSYSRSNARREGVQLIFVGGGARKHTESLKEQCEASGVSDQVSWIESLSTDDVPLVLSGARALLFPSRYEGFGLPILEAMACGVPGVSSNCACLPEVAGDIWTACDPDDADAFAHAFDQLVFDDAVWAQTSEAGIERASTFTWDRCAERLAACLSLVATGTGIPQS